MNQVVIQTYPDTTTPVEYTLAPGVTPADYTGMDRFGRITNLLWKQSSTPLVELEYGYDLGSNRTFRRDNLGNSSGYSEAYDYDKLQRLTKFERGELNSTNDHQSQTRYIHQTFRPADFSI